MIGLKAASNREWLRLLDPVDTIFNLVFFLGVLTCPLSTTKRVPSFHFLLTFFFLIFFHSFKKTEFHALLHRGQALNAYEAKMHLDNGTLNFGHGLDFESGKTKKAERRPPTQIEIMAEMEREKQAKKEERRQAREAKKQARLEQEEFIRNGGNIKLSKKEKRRLEAEMEN